MLTTELGTQQILPSRLWHRNNVLGLLWRAKIKNKNIHPENTLPRLWSLVRSSGLIYTVSITIV